MNPHIRNYEGQRLGQLVVLRREGTKKYFPFVSSKRKRPNSFVLWRVRCDCGKEKLVTSNSLRLGTVTCGCTTGRWKRYESGEAARRSVLRYYRYSAKNRHFDWQLTDDDFFILTRADCHYCGVAPSKVASLKSGCYVYNGIDRKENSLGYTLENSVTCCEICNLAKRDLSYDDFIDYLRRVCRHQEKLQFLTISTQIR